MTNSEIRKLLAELRFIGRDLPAFDERITIRNNYITNLNMNNLNLSEFKHFPISIFGFKHLESLSLRDNNLQAIPEEIQNLPNLKHLDISNNKIENFPNFIQNTPIETLRLKNNNLSDLSTLENIPNLTELNISANHLTSMDPIIENVSNLHYLSLASNQIREIPENIISMENLSFLNLRSNNIHHLPQTLNSMPSLGKINLYDNPLQSVIKFDNNTTVFIDPQTKSGESNYKRLYPRIKDHRFSRVHPPQFVISKKMLPFSSIMIYGDDYVGKQSLLEYYLYNVLIPDNSLTIELNRYLNWDYYIYLKDNMILQVWYPYTQEKFSPTYNTSVLNGFYYASGIMLVFDKSNPDTFNTVLNSIKQIYEIRMQSCPIVIVGNKKDLTSPSSLSTTEVENYLERLERTLGINLPYIETSLYGHQVKSVFETLYNLLKE